MARERMVTRTITEANVNVMAVLGREVKDITVNVPSVTGLTESQVIDKAKSNMPEGYMFVTATAVSYNDKLYGMSEEDFIKHAKVLPPRTVTQPE